MTTMEKLPGWILKKDRILYWRDRYNSEEDSCDASCERQLGAELRRQCFVSHKEMERLVAWKFSGDARITKKVLDDLAENPPGFIRRILLAALHTSNDADRIRQLTQIKGVGPSVASVILAFFDPQNYGIIDIHAWRELFEPSRKAKTFSETDFFRITKVFRYLSRRHGLPCREVEKAIFKKNKDH